MKKALVILGPTATGKTDLALSLAKKFSGELVAADSRQVYKGLDIGTGKEPGIKAKVTKQKDSWIVDGVTIKMYDVVSVKKQYNLFDYIQQALPLVEEISKRDELPIIVGGTGLYIKGLLLGLDKQVPTNRDLRDELEELSLGELQKKLRSLSPSRWEEISESDKKNKRRLIRYIELFIMNPYIDEQRVRGLVDLGYEVLKIGLSAPRPVLNQKIDARVLDWLKLGIIQEVESLIRGGVDKNRFFQLGLEYKQVGCFLEGEIDLKQLTERMQAEVRQYAKRQMTWFKKDPEIVWFDITQKGFEQNLEREVSSWYYSGKSKS